MNKLFYIVMAFTLTFSFSGCANQPKVAKDKTKIDEATREMVECGRRNAPLLDDGVSDASSIAFAIAGACSSSYQALIEKFCIYQLDNDMQCKMFRDIRNTRDKKIESFIQIVLESRANGRNKQ